MAASRKEVPRYETRELAAHSVSSAKHEASDVPSNATPSVWRTVRSVLGIAEGGLPASARNAALLRAPQSS